MPGTAIDNDWRNRTEHCDVWKALCTMVETELRNQGWRPLSVHPIRRRVEAAFLDAWAAGVEPTLAGELNASRPSPTADGDGASQAVAVPTSGLHEDVLDERPGASRLGTSHQANLGGVVADRVALRRRRVRCCALMRMSPERFVASTGRWADRRVSALGLAREALSQWPYSTNAVKAAPGRPFVLCVGLGKLADLGALKSAFDMGDDAALADFSVTRNAVVLSSAKLEKGRMHRHDLAHGGQLDQREAGADSYRGARTLRRECSLALAGSGQCRICRAASAVPPVCRSPSNSRRR